MRDPASDPKPDMTPMIDIVFQLLIFFLVTMKFKTLDMKIGAHLPKDAGVDPTPAPPLPPPLMTRLSRALQGGVAAAHTRVAVGPVRLGDTADGSVWERLTAHARRTRERHVATGADPATLAAEVDASALVSTGDVVRALDALQAAQIEKITFRGTPPPGRPKPGR